MTAEITFDVRGMPVPQGSARAFVRGSRAVVTTVSAPLRDWRSAIATEARQAVADRPLLEGPVAVALTFRFPRPQSHYLPAGAKRPYPELRLDAPQMVSRTPDIDKVARAGLDAMTSVVWRDDAQVADLRAVKRYCRSDEGPGVLVVIRPLAATA